MWAARILWRCAPSKIRPAGPSFGIGYGTGLTVQNRKLPSSAARNRPRQLNSTCEGSVFSYIPLAVTLPDIQHRVADPAAISRQHPSRYERGRTYILLPADVAADINPGSVRPIKRSKHAAFERSFWLLIGVIINNHSQAHYIAHQEKFVATSIGDLASLGVNLGQVNEFVGGEIYLPGERMEMFHRRLQQLLSTWVGCIIERAKGSLGNGGGVSFGRDRLHGLSWSRVCSHPPYTLAAVAVTPRDFSMRSAATESPLASAMAFFNLPALSR